MQSASGACSNIGWSGGAGDSTRRSVRSGSTGACLSIDLGCFLNIGRIATPTCSETFPTYPWYLCTSASSTGISYDRHANTNADGTSILLMRHMLNTFKYITAPGTYVAFTSIDATSYVSPSSAIGPYDSLHGIPGHISSFNKLFCLSHSWFRYDNPAQIKPEQSFNGFCKLSDAYTQPYYTYAYASPTWLCISHLQTRHIRTVIVS